MSITRSVSALTLMLTLVACQQTSLTQKVVEGKPKVPIISENDDRDYASLQLPNGLEILLVSDPSAEKSAASLSVGVGALQDPNTQAGMAHYFEHMLFLGTEKYPDTAEYGNFMSNNGGASNAYTWLEITNYMFQINNDAYDEALDRFSDFFKSPKLYAEYTEKEKNAVNAEWSMRREMDFFGRFSLARELFGEHPSNRFLIGNLETLANNDGTNLHEETVKFYNQHYSANKMKLALLSNLPIDTMRALATKHFAAIKNKNVEEYQVTTPISADKRGGKNIYYVPNEDVKQVILDFTITDNSADYLVKPNRIVSYLIGSEMVGTPAYLLKQQGLISSLSASATPNMYGNYGTLSVDIELTDRGMQHRDEVVKTVMQYIQLIKQQGVDKKYFTEIKTMLANRFRFLEKGGAFGYVSTLAANMQEYPIQDVIAAPYRFEKFDEQAINKVLAQLNSNNLKVWFISKAEKADQGLHFYDGRYRLEDFNQEQVATWEQLNPMLKMPKVNTLLPENFNIHENPAMELPNLTYDSPAVKIWHYPSQLFKTQPKGVMRVYFNNQARLHSVKAQVLQSLWVDLFNVAESELLTEASVAGMNLSLSDKNGMELSLGGFTDKQMQLLNKGLAAMQIQVTDLAFQQAVDRFVRGTANSEKRFPYSQLFSNLNKVISQFGSKNAELIEVANALTAEDLRQFIQHSMQTNQVRVFAFGNYSQADLAYVADKITKVLPDNHQVSAYTQSPLWKPLANTRLAWQKDIPVADNALLDISMHSEPSVANRAIAKIIGQHIGTKAFDKLRTEEQLAYAVGAFAFDIRDYSGLAMYIQAPSLDLPATQQRFDEFKKQYLADLASFTEQEFNQLRDSLLISLKEQPKNLTEEMSEFISDWYKENWQFDSKTQLINAVENAQFNDFKRYYQQTIANAEAPRIRIQLRGTTFRDVDFDTYPREQVVSDLNSFHKTMPVQ
ncbi:insulinase family protein [Paraglaciecola aestuariivivens]